MIKQRTSPAIADILLPGVPVDAICARLNRSRGNEIKSGKFASPQSSAALAVNCFGWFLDKPELLPPFPRLNVEYPPKEVEIEYEVRFPWSGGTHPWLDAVVSTQRELIGIESKRFEPFGSRKKAKFSPAYDRDVWKDGMERYEQLKVNLKSGEVTFRHLDATQLVKHALGLATKAHKDNKQPILVYLFAEPDKMGERTISESSLIKHREEILHFADAVRGDRVEFFAISYREWMDTWPQLHEQAVQHWEALKRIYRP